MADATQPELPEGTPDDIRKFVACTVDKLVLKPGKLEWIDLPVSPDVAFDQPKGDKNQATVKLSVFGEKVGSLTVSIKDGQFTLDTSSWPSLLPGKDNAAKWVKDLNDWLKSQGKKFGELTLKDGNVTVTKVNLTTAAAVPPVGPPIATTGEAGAAVATSSASATSDDPGDATATSGEPGPAGTDPVLASWGSGGEAAPVEASASAAYGASMTEAERAILADLTGDGDDGGNGNGDDVDVEDDDHIEKSPLRSCLTSPVVLLLLFFAVVILGAVIIVLTRDSGGGMKTNTAAGNPSVGQPADSGGEQVVVIAFPDNTFGDGCFAFTVMPNSTDVHLIANMAKVPAGVYNVTMLTSTGSLSGSATMPAAVPYIDVPVHFTRFATIQAIAADGPGGPIDVSHLTLLPFDLNATSEQSTECDGSKLKPIPTGSAVSDQTLAQDFLTKLGGFFIAGDVKSEYDLLNPLVKEQFTLDQCRPFLDSLTDPTQKFVVNSISGPADYGATVGSQTVTFPSTYTVATSHTRNGRVGEETNHLPRLQNGQLSWIASCSTTAAN